HLYKSFGWEGLRFYFIDNNIGRITGEVAGSNTDPLFYLYNIVWAFLPWTILLFIVIFFEIRNMAKGVSRDASKAGLLGSVLVLFIVLSSAKGKVPNYMMMMVAPLAVVISGWSQYILKLPQKLLRGLIVAQSILLIMISVLLLITLYLFIDDFDRLPLVLVLISCVAIYFVARLKDNSLVKIVLSSVIITATVNLYFNTVVIPELYSYQGCRKVLDIFEEKRQKADILYNFEVEEYELFYYADDNVVNISNWEGLYEAMEKPDSWIYTNMIKYNDVLNMDYPVDTVYEIRQRGMNRITLEFLNPLTREESLITNYLIKTGDKRDSRTE
ncbi:MAG: hypothetical protein PHH93_14340, partial [Prolixibacteraceae bacterium]|nr:hypothetical protein [Prolixibacteraceae bacterium]